VVRDDTTHVAMLPGLLGTLVIIACGENKLPTAPSDLVSGIAIYEHANFQGRSSQVVRDIADLRDVDGPCEHESSSTAGGHHHVHELG
jgi:hypothetical protein